MGRPMGSNNTLPPPLHALIDKLHEELNLKTDGQLCQLLQVSRSTISKIRHRTNKVSADFILRVHKATGWPIERIESYL